MTGIKDIVERLEKTYNYILEASYNTGIGTDILHCPTDAITVLKEKDEEIEELKRLVDELLEYKYMYKDLCK